MHYLILNVDYFKKGEHVNKWQGSAIANINIRLQASAFDFGDKAKSEIEDVADFYKVLKKLEAKKKIKNLIFNSENKEARMRGKFGDARGGGDIEILKAMDSITPKKDGRMIKFIINDKFKNEDGGGIGTGSMEKFRPVKNYSQK